MSSFRDHIRHAVEIKGSQSKLAVDAGCSQQAISFLLTDAETISAEMAIKIDRATNGIVSKEKLRPDLFKQETADRVERFAPSPKQEASV